MKAASKSAEGPQVSAEKVAAFRLSRHHLATPASKASLAGVAGDMGGAQAQIMSAAGLSLRARIRGLRPEDVERALWQDRALAKIWCMRGTVHIVPSDDLSVLKSHGHEVVILQACHPRFFATHRYLAYAVPIRVEPRVGPPYSPPEALAAPAG